MIELLNDGLHISFPAVHHVANLSIEFQRTLRIPDDGSDYPLPPGLGAFPLRHVDDFAERVPAPWLQHGGVMLPMYQSEALWIRFRPENPEYPFAVKIAAGKVCAVSGEGWSNELHRNPQDYLVKPIQPRLDGYCVKRGLIRQFVAMPLGARYSAEEQVTGQATHGGLQVIVRPMRREVFTRRFPERDVLDGAGLDKLFMPDVPASSFHLRATMGLAPGGRMRQEVYEDPFDFEDWDRDNRSRCFVHLANSLVWRDITGEDPPTTPPTAREYARAGLPWFEWYDDSTMAVDGGERLNGLKSVAELEREKGDAVLPENESVTPNHVVELRRGLKKGQVREGRF